MYLQYFWYGFYELRWIFIIGFILGILNLIFLSSYAKEISFLVSICGSIYIGYQYTAQAPKYRYLANILLSMVVFSSILCIFMFFSFAFDTSSKLSPNSFIEIPKLVLHSILMTQIGAFSYFLKSLWLKRCH